VFEQLDGVAENAACLRSAQAKWERLTASDYGEIRSLAQLIAKVAERYSLPPEQAKHDVEIWAREMRI
jgi:hypothetical protein